VAGAQGFGHGQPQGVDSDRPAWTRVSAHAELAKLDPVWEQFNQDSDAVAAHIEVLLAEHDR